ncbi:MAG: MBL fold metallo-hydrolase [Nannocystaceae bacterium]|nr:MBL fold metallo-hydrolase [bacterium]
MDFGQDTLEVCGLTLAGVTRGGIATSLRVPELGLLFDVGVPTAGQLRCERILVSHGHQDHLGGLPYLLSQRHLARKKPADVHVPAEIVDPLTRIFEAWAEIEDFRMDVRLHGTKPGDVVSVGKGMEALALRSVHRVPSLAWLVRRTTRRLKPEFAGRAPQELQAMRRDGDPITEEHVEPLLCVTGDTKIELFDAEPLVRQAKVLVHEVTSWDDRRDVEHTRSWGHTHIDEVLARVEQFEGEALVLVHRSARHSRAQALKVIADRFPAAVRDKIHVFGR